MGKAAILKLSIVFSVSGVFMFDEQSQWKSLSTVTAKYIACAQPSEIKALHSFQ
jgi:hypothetical protein